VDFLVLKYVIIWQSQSEFELVSMNPRLAPIVISNHPFTHKKSLSVIFRPKTNSKAFRHFRSGNESAKKGSVDPWLKPGADVIIFEIFLSKKIGEKFGILTQNKAE
jgi:hypothetical protein